MANPSIPPPLAPNFPSDAFEQWLARQALAGHDRMWLQRNRPALKQRWRSDPNAELPPPPPRDPGKVPDRYSEL